MPPHLLGVPPYYNASAIIGGSAANRVTPHFLEVPPAELAEWCMVRGGTAKLNILGGGERHSPIITLLPPPPILSPAFRFIVALKNGNDGKTKNH